MLSKNKKIAIGIFAVMLVAVYTAANLGNNDLSLEKLKRGAAPAVKIIRDSAEKIGDALFDIILTIPDDEILLRENLLISVELTNFGSAGKTDVELTYIITDSFGNVVLIEHEKRVVETQLSFLKEINLPNDLGYGNYNLLVEMLYSDTSALASKSFKIMIP